VLSIRIEFQSASLLAFSNVMYIHTVPKKNRGLAIFCICCAIMLILWAWIIFLIADEETSAAHKAALEVEQDVFLERSYTEALYNRLRKPFKQWMMECQSKGSFRLPPRPEGNCSLGKNLTAPMICVIARASLNQSASLLPAFVTSLLSNQYSNFHVWILPTDLPYSEEHWRLQVRRLNLFSKKRFLSLAKTHPSVSSNWGHYLPKTGDYGYVATDLQREVLSYSTVEDFLLGRTEIWDNDTSLAAPAVPSHRKLRDPLCDYFLFTNADNLYVSVLFQDTLPFMQMCHDLVGFEFVSHYEWSTATGPIIAHPDGAKFVQVFTDFQMGVVDLGAVLIRSEHLERSYDGFIMSLLRCDLLLMNTHDLDGYLYERLAKINGSRNLVLRRALFFHQ